MAHSEDDDTEIADGDVTPQAEAAPEVPADPDVPMVDVLYKGAERQVSRPGNAEREGTWYKPGESVPFPALDAEAAVKKWPEFFAYANPAQAAAAIQSTREMIAARFAASKEA